VLQYAIAIGNTLCGGGGWRRDWSLGTPVDFSKIGVWELLVTMNVGGVSFSKIHILKILSWGFLKSFWIWRWEGGGSQESTGTGESGRGRGMG